jgi:beta-aspartyl-peptidase (threonine type)
MRYLVATGLLFSSLVLGDDNSMQSADDPLNPIAIVIHGGAGTIDRARMSAEVEGTYRAKLAEAVEAGFTKLKSGASSREAVIAAIEIMEDSPLFNAGHGAVLNHEGDVELDASIMTGDDLSAGAIAGVRRIRNPIRLADRVLTHSPHVMLIGAGAEEFASDQEFELVDNSYFRTERRARQLKRAREKAEQTLSESAGDDFETSKQLGTVGAVALDRKGVIAAGTSTGGMTNKQFGRVGDSPVIGAGTYADSACGVSATGHGEFFIRAVVAHDICARMRYQGVSLAEAADAVVNDRLVAMGADGGLIALDAAGNITTPFNSTGMYRASIGADGVMTVDIFR